MTNQETSEWFEIDAEAKRLLDNAAATIPSPYPDACDLHWRALAIQPTARYWLKRSTVEHYVWLLDQVYGVTIVNRREDAANDTRVAVETLKELAR